SRWRAQLRAQAAIDVEHLSGHEARRVGGQIQDRAGDVLRRPATAERELLTAALGREVVRAGGTDRVDTDAERPEVDRESTGQAIDAAFRRVVDRIVEVRALRSADRREVDDRTI